jgi:hypothetical protein
VGLPGVDTVVVQSDSVQPSTFTVAWSEPEAMPLPPNPILYYSVAINYTATINGKNLTTTTHILENVPAGDRDYSRTYDTSNTHVTPGADGWIAVIPFYQLGGYGIVAQNVAHRVTNGFVISGRVISDQGTPLDGVTVLIPSCGLSTTTSDSGSFAFAPLSDEQAFALQTDASGDWFDYNTLPVGAADPEVLICLISRAPLDYLISGLDYKFTLGAMTRWFYHNVGTTRPYVRWASFPLNVYIDAGWNNNGTVDMAAAVRDQIDYLNTAIGREMWTEVPDTTNAQIVVRYRERSGFYGVTVLNPDTGGGVWGTTPPVKMRVVISPVLTTELAVQKLINHEFGHSLCFGSHSTNTQHLMNYGGGFDPGVPTADDLRMFRSITTIPIGTDFNRYEQ